MAKVTTIQTLPRIQGAIALIILLISCGKDQPSCETCYADIFRCKINGVLWEPYCSPDPPFGCNATHIQYYDDIKYIEMNSKNEKLGTAFHFLSFNTKLGDKTKVHFDNALFGNDLLIVNCRNYTLDTNQINFIKINDINYNKRIIKGNFEFTCINNCNDTIRVTEGMFDLKY